MVNMWTLGCYATHNQALHVVFNKAYKEERWWVFNNSVDSTKNWVEGGIGTIEIKKPKKLQLLRLVKFVTKSALGLQSYCINIHITLDTDKAYVSNDVWSIG